MPERERLSIEELKRVGWRIKSIRSLTGLNQEEFALKSDINYMTLRGWEFGRALPRPDGVNRILSSLANFGIQVTSEWIIFGEGSGPILNKNSRTYDDKRNTNLIIEAFKKEQRVKGNNPVVISISDDFMKPMFNLGDIVGGIVLSINDIKNKYLSCDINAQKWLVPTQHHQWMVREVLFYHDKIYIKSLKSADIEEVSIVTLAKIIFHYFDGEQT